MASHLFLDGAATPVSGGIRRGIPSLTLIHTFLDRAYSTFAITCTASEEEGANAIGPANYRGGHLSREYDRFRDSNF